MILETIAESDSLEEAAVMMAGNYKNWRNYAFFGTDIPRFDTLMLGYLTDCNPSLRQLVNIEAVTQGLQPYLGVPQDGATANIYKQDFCGDKDVLTGVMVQVYAEDGTITPAFQVMYMLAKKLQASVGEVIDGNLFKTVNEREVRRYVGSEIEWVCDEEGVTYKQELIDYVVEYLRENEIDYDDVSIDDIKDAICEAAVAA